MDTFVVYKVIDGEVLKDPITVNADIFSDLNYKNSRARYFKSKEEAESSLSSKKDIGENSKAKKSIGKISLPIAVTEESAVASNTIKENV